MDLPTYTNIWRIEKRLYKLYDFRLPAPLPITWIAVFSGITFPYVVFLFAIGVPFNHDLVWLYVLPPGVLTWLTTRPVIEGKRLPELIGSQLRYVSEPRSWDRMAPATEKDEVLVAVKVWRRNPDKIRGKARKNKPGKVRPPARAKQLTDPRVPVPIGATTSQLEPVERFDAAIQFGPAERLEPLELVEPARQFGPVQQHVQERATAGPAWPHRSPTRPARDSRPGLQSLVSTGWEPRPAPLMGQPAPPMGEPATAEPEPYGPVPEPYGPAPEFREPAAELPEPAAELPEPAAEFPEPAAEYYGPELPEPQPVAELPEPEPELGEPELPEPEPEPELRLTTDPEPQLAEAALPESTEPPALPDAIEQEHEHQQGQGQEQTEDGRFKALELSHDAEPAPWLAPPADLPSWSGPPQAQASSRHVPQRVRSYVRPPEPVAKASVVNLDSERPVPSVERALSAPGGRRDLSWRRRVKVVAGGQGPGKRDQEEVDRARAQREIAGSRWIVVLGCHSAAGQTLTALATGRVLVSLRHHPVAALTGDVATPVKASSLLAGQRPPRKGLDVIGEDGADYKRLHGILADRYALTIVDPAPSGLTRVLALADQLIIVAPATDQAASNLASTQQWLDAHGYSDLAARAVTVINGVHKEQMPDVLRAESVARGRCRAIVRVPYDAQLTTRNIRPVQSLSVQTRLAYTALAGVVVAGLAAPAAPGQPSQSAKESR